MIRLRHGCKVNILSAFDESLTFQGIADAGIGYASAARAIFDCQRELAETIPGLSGQCARRLRIVYGGF